jgi:hypothetical protein
MNERIHEYAMPFSANFPSIGPTIVFAIATFGRFEKPYSTPRCDEYPTRGTPFSTPNGGISKPKSQST